MDRKKIFRDSEQIRTKAKRDERRLNMHVTGDLEGSLRIGLSVVDQEKKKILAELQKTRIRSSKFASNGLSRSDPYPSRNEGLSKYSRATSSNFREQPLPSYMSPTRSSRNYGDRGRSRGSQNVRSLEDSAQFSNGASPDSRRNTSSRNYLHDDDNKRIQLKIKQFNNSAGGAVNGNDLEQRMRVKMENLDVSGVVNNNNNSNDDDKKNAYLYAEELKREKSLSEINLRNAKDNIARRLRRSSPDGARPTDGDGTSEVPEKPELRKRQTSTVNKTTDGDPRPVVDLEETRARVYPHSYARRHSKFVSVTDFLANPIFDPELYGPDGHLRTVHAMPSFQDSYNEARKAKYIRHPAKHKPEFETELSVRDIFEN